MSTNNVTLTQETVIVELPKVDISKLREAFANVDNEADIKAGEYAAGLIQTLGVAWITMPHDQKGPEGDAMRAERDALYALLRARKTPHKNPSVKWSQIKKHATAMLAEQAKAEALARGETIPETEAPKGNAKHTRSTQLTLLEDLTTLYKHCKRNSKVLTDAQRKAHMHIGSALSDLGVDVSML